MEKNDEVKEKSKEEDGMVLDDEDLIFPRPKEKKFKVGPKKSITITFRGNRTFELNLGHEVMRFEGRETKTV